VAPATGRAGDVALCHSFLVDTAQPHLVRCAAQPPIVLKEPVALDRLDGDHSQIERAVRLDLPQFKEL
jgi:hypothetical protein